MNVPQDGIRTPETVQIHRKTFSEASEVTVNVTQETEATSPLSPLTPDGKRCRSLPAVQYPHHEPDDDSSHDGSYFADPSHLPSPKSDRRFSSRSKLHGSDASLSLSDDSEDDHQEPRPGSDHRIDLYPQQLTRIHSISSLVSGSSMDDEEVKTPSGRKSPVMGQHPPSRSNGMHGASPASQPNPQPSPPTILSSYQQQQQQQHPAYLHPQAQVVSATAPLWNSTPLIPPRVQFSSPTAQQTASSSGSKSSGGLAYSDDSDSLLHMMPHHSFTQVPPHRSHGVPLQQRVPAGFYQNYGRQFDGEPSGDNTMNVNDKGDPRLDPSMGQDAHVYTSSGSVDDDLHSEADSSQNDGGGFKVYWQRWLMLLYMSLLNLLSDWTCYSVAPIAVLTEEAYGHISSEQLVVLFLAANAVATACEPILLSRLGLRKTVLFGALLLMIGSIVKSGGMPPIIQPTLVKGRDEWRVYFGFFLVGLSQPLYQCTPALLSASWFPEKERTMATGVALNANQVGIGFAFIFGTLLVKTSEDILSYFSLLSILSTLTFLGTLIQFDDAPPTPPSNTARVMRGTMEVKLPSIKNLFESVRNLGATRNIGLNLSESGTGDEDMPKPFRSQAPRRSRRLMDHEDAVNNEQGDEEERDGAVPGLRVTTSEDALRHAPAPSPANWDEIVTEQGTDPGAGFNQSDFDHGSGGRVEIQNEPPLSIADTAPDRIEFDHQYVVPYPQYQPVWDARTGQYAYYPVSIQQPLGAFGLQHPVQQYAHTNAYSAYDDYSSARYYDSPFSVLPPLEEREEGVEPVLTLTPHRLDINIRDDQVWLSIKACMMRPGFIHSLVSFTVSGIVINTLSTFMDYLVRLNGAGREYTGIVGGSFQFVIMISSLLMGQFTDKTRAYYSIVVGMLVLGAFGLAECGVNLDADKGVELRFSLIIVAALVGPLQPVSTELGVETAYPLSENTVLVIQQLFSNLLSACFIPCFKAFKNFELSPVKHAHQAVHPQQFTFSFYLLIVLHAVGTVFFATFNGRYLRLEHEEERNENERVKQQQETPAGYGSFYSGGGQAGANYDSQYAEEHPLLT